MRLIKGAVVGLLTKSFRKDDEVVLIAFRGTGAQVLLEPSRQMNEAATALEYLPTGGRTPLSSGLLRAADTLRRERLRDTSRRPLLVVVTDGRYSPGEDPSRAAGLLAGRTLSLDCT